MTDDQTLHALPCNTINLIGSCQVITSVYSVVKELVENSLDANASSIDIKLENYGLEKIEVIDNGYGVKAADVPFMGKRHFTSKITCSEDLNFLATYGFRGEALGSLCAVSNVTITTKTAEDQLSHVYTIGSEGDVLDKKPSHMGKGTIVTSRNLFHNVPVRKQFYGASNRKRDDLRKIELLLMAYAIVKPALRLTLKHGKEFVFQKTALKDVKSALHSVFGRQVANQMLYRKKSVEELKLKVCAFLPKPGSDVKEMSLVMTEKTFVAVNNRPVSLPEINKILRSYYSNCHGLDNYRHPLCFVSLDIATNLIDVNVEPNKTKVFFQQKSEIQVALEEILVEVYDTLDNVPSWHYADANGNAEVTKGTDGAALKKKPMRPDIIYTKWPGDETELSEDERSDDMTKLKEKNASVEKEQTVEKVNKLPSFSLTFHTKSSDCGESTSQDLEHLGNNETITGSSLENNMGKLDDKELVPETEMSFEEERSELIMTGLKQPAEDKSGETANGVISDESGNVMLIDENELSPPEREIPVCDVIVVNDGESGDTEKEKAALLSDEMTLNEMPEKECGLTNHGNSDLEIDPDAWSRGHVTSASTLLQPVTLLPSSKVQVSGKRPLSPSSKRNEPVGPSKRKGLKLTVPPNQTTLLDMMNSSQVKKPDSPFTHFHQAKYPSLSQEFPDESENEIKERLKEAWNNLDNDERMPYREKCWHDTKRYEKQTKTTKYGCEEKLVTKATNKGKRILKKRLYCKERTVKVSMDEIRNPRKERDSDKPDELVAIGPSYKCENVWFCSLQDKLYMVNVSRLCEVSLYKKLKSEFKLPFKSCDPLTLNSSTLKEKALEMLGKLARQDEGKGTFFHLTDERLVSNGFDIRCHCDANGNVTSELVGFCSVIPAYDLKDLNRVLEILHSNSIADLSQTRTLKAAYYLQGEAVRMTRQNTVKKTLYDVQELLDNAVGNIDRPCLHHKPIFKELYDFSNSQFEID